MASRDDSGRARANEAISEVASARAKLARRVDAPWWYRWGVSTAILTMFLGFGFVIDGPGSYQNETLGIVLVIAGGILAPIALLAVLKSATGVSIDRYAESLGWWWVLLFALLVLSFALQAFFDVPLALFVGGLAAFAVTVAMENRINQILHRRLTDAQQAT